MVITLERRMEAPVDAVNRYTRTSIESADQLTLLTMLYDGLLRFLGIAMDKMLREENAHEDCIRARDIAHHLLHSTIDDGSEISTNTRSLCFHMYKEIITADMEKSADRIEQIIPVARSLRTGWAGLKEKERNDPGER